MARTDPRPHYGTGRRIRHDGYVDLWDPGHPIARRDGYVSEHRRVAFDAGLLTNDSDHVHHLNGNKTDNRIENLEVIDAATHQRERHTHEAKGWAGENRAKTHCIRGHRLAAPNLVESQLPNRMCRTCNNNRRRYARGLPPKEVYS